MGENENSPAELLAKDLYIRIKEFSESDEYCIVDRINSFSFSDVFKDAINSYRSDVVICERLYFKDRCISVKRPVYNITDEAKQVYNDFIHFSEDELSGDITDDTMNKFNEFQKKLDEVSPEIKDIDVLMYKSGYNGDGYPVVELRTIPDETLQHISQIMARFVIEYFLTLKFTLSDNYSVSIFPVNYDDHIDITAKFSTT